MGLEKYREKRRFDRTPEPRGREGRRARGELRFVVQKHAARRLHYDFRLELDGVLRSWAIPKGPSHVPGNRRLATQTEDHPLEYADFEGVIPRGQYGGGTVLVWDQGTWEPVGDPRRGLEKGELTFLLSEALVTEAVPGPRRADGRQGPRYAAAADFWTISWIQDGCVQA